MDFSAKIETERLVLERPYPATFELAQELYQTVDASREHIAKWLSWAETMESAEQEFAVLINYYEKNWNEQTSFAYLIREKLSGELLGVIDLIHVNTKHFSAEIGFWLKESACGHGYMTEAVLGLEKEAFKQGFHRIVIGNDTENTKSANVAKNAGYHFEGIMHEDRFDKKSGTFRSSNVWAKLKKEA